jgi:predicted metal-dependent hydrolase
MKQAAASQNSAHPMDDFPVRKLEFNFDNIEFNDPLWSRSHRDFSMLINALGVHVPHFERYLVKTMIEARPKIKDENLQSDMTAIIGQEAQHAKNFLHYNKWLAKRYPKIAQLENDAQGFFNHHSKIDSLKRKVGYTAGYETFTFLAGLIILENYDRWMKDSDPAMKALWVWHQVEEIEHGAVAFDMYKTLYGDAEWYRKWMVLAALAHIASETIKCYTAMTIVEGYWRNPFRGIRKMGFCAYMLSLFLINALPVFKRSYHPRNHKLVSGKKNTIQIAWRRYEHDGGDVLSINREKMAEILGIANPGA